MRLVPAPLPTDVGSAPTSAETVVGELVQHSGSCPAIRLTDHAINTRFFAVLAEGAWAPASAQVAGVPVAGVPRDGPGAACPPALAIGAGVFLRKHVRTRARGAVSTWSTTIVQIRRTHSRAGGAVLVTHIHAACWTRHRHLARAGGGDVPVIHRKGGWPLAFARWRWPPGCVTTDNAVIGGGGRPRPARVSAGHSAVIKVLRAFSRRIVCRGPPGRQEAAAEQRRPWTCRVCSAGCVPPASHPDR